MGYLIDTTVLLELQKGDRANAGVWEWYEAVEQIELFPSVLVIGKLRQGIERLRRRDAIQAARLEECLLARNIRDMERSGIPLLNPFSEIKG